MSHFSKYTLLSITTALSCSLLHAGDTMAEDLKKKAKDIPQLPKEQVLKQHKQDSVILANDQDELAADVQDLIQDQTSKPVITLLEEAEFLMGEAIELLEEKKTGGNTIAIETEIIEKIYEAAKKKQQQSGSSGQSDSMMKRMEEMMGKSESQDSGSGTPEEAPGKGNNGGDTDANNDNKTGSSDNTKEERVVPKSTSAPNQTLPREEQRALDAYKKAMSGK